MTTPLTYLEFVAAFVAVPAVALLALGPGVADHRRRTALVGVVIMLVVAFSYTTPWDNLLIAAGAWSYGAGTVAFRVWNAPIGEYAFIALETLLASLWLYRRPLPLSDGASGTDDRDATAIPDGSGVVDEATPSGPTARADPTQAGSVDDPTRTADVEPEDDADAPRIATRDTLIRVGGAGAWLVAAALGALALSGLTLYLGAILAWAGPVLALQWAVGGPYLVSARRHVAWAVAVPTLYLSSVDRLAIEWGLWTISPAHSTGLTVAGLPIEEGAFFLVTSLMIVQGLVLFHWVLETRPFRAALGR